MSNATSHKNILVAIDYSEMSTDVVEQAWSLALQDSSCSLHFLHVRRGTTTDEWDQEGGHMELLEWLDARLPEDANEHANVHVVAHEACGEPWQVIVHMAADLQVDMVVMGTHGRKGLQRVMLGSVAETVSRLCGCSVLVVRRKTHESLTVPREPACGVCAETRIQSQGNVLWCHDHATRRDRRHTYLDKRLGRRILGIAKG